MNIRCYHPFHTLCSPVIYFFNASRYVSPSLSLIHIYGHHYNEENLPPLHKGDILLCGHTHVPKCTEHEDFIYMNPGSVSIPKEESWHGYMIYDLSLIHIFWKVLNVPG